VIIVCYIVRDSTFGMWVHSTKGCRVCVAVCVLQCVCCSLVRTSDMDGLRLVGSLKLQVSFAEYRLFYRALLQ